MLDDEEDFRDESEGFLLVDSLVLFTLASDSVFLQISSKVECFLMVKMTFLIDEFT